MVKNNVRKSMKSDIGLLIMRLGFGGMMFFSHGQGKLFNFTNYKTKFPDPLGIGPEFSLALAVFAEFFCAIALVIGLKTRWATIPLFITMIVAAFVVHAGDPFKKQEFALLYALGYAALFFTGGGKLSVDALIEKKS